MDGERETCASRRALLTGAPAAAAIAAVAAETGIALANVADPYVTLCSENERLRTLWIASRGAEAERVNDLWMANERRLLATCATTGAGALAALRIILREIDVEEDPLIAGLLKGAIAGLEREVSHV